MESGKLFAISEEVAMAGEFPLIDLFRALLWPSQQASVESEQHIPILLGVGGDSGSLGPSEGRQSERYAFEEIWDGLIDLLTSIGRGISAIFQPRKAQKTHFHQLREKWFPSQVVINPNHNRDAMKKEFKEMDEEDFKLILMGYYGEKKDLTPDEFVEQLSGETKSFGIEGREDLNGSYGLTSEDLEFDLSVNDMFKSLAQKMGEEFESAKDMVNYLREGSNLHLLEAALQLG